MPHDAIVKMAQTFRSGTNDIDAIDFVEMFLDDEQQTSPDDLNDLYVLVNFRPGASPRGTGGWTAASPATTTPSACRRSSRRGCDSRTTSTVSGSSRTGIVAAHVDAAQNHTKSNYMRNPPAAEIFNEEVSNLLKRKIKDTVHAAGRAERSRSTTKAK